MKFTKLDHNNWICEDTLIKSLADHLSAIMEEHLASDAPVHFVLEGQGDFIPFHVGLDVRVHQGVIQVMGFIAMAIPNSPIGVISGILNRSNEKTLEDVEAIVNFHLLENLEARSIGPETETQALLFSTINWT
jgi:hypothetical protein